jgi:condensin complex subunit 2
MEVDDVEDYDYENAADKNDYCPGVEDDDYGGDFNDADNIDTSFDADSQNRFDSQGDYADQSMVDAPKMVDKAALQIGYAKTAKKVDMKRIKNVTWEILTH